MAFSWAGGAFVVVYVSEAVVERERTLWGCSGGAGRGEAVKTIQDGEFDFETVLDELDFGERALLACAEHAREALRAGIGEYVVEVGRDCFWPDSHSATEFLEPDFAPVLAHWSREQL